jgi:hypothetical protein
MHAWCRKTNRLHPPKRRRPIASLRRNHKRCARSPRLAQPRSVWPHCLASSMVACRFDGIPDGTRSRSLREVPEVRLRPRLCEASLRAASLTDASSGFFAPSASSWSHLSTAPSLAVAMGTTGPASPFRDGRACFATSSRFGHLADSAEMLTAYRSICTLSTYAGQAH